MKKPSNQLFDAIDRGGRNRIRELVESGQGLEQANADGDTPLLHAIRKGRHAAIKILLESGADPNHLVPLRGIARHDRGKQIKWDSPLALAIFQFDAISIELLLQHGADLKEQGCGAAACYILFFGHRTAEQIVIRLLDAGLDPKSTWKGERLYRIAERHPNVLLKLKALGESMKPRKEAVVRKPKPTKSEENQQTYGVSDFIRFIDDWGHPTWAVLGVEAPIDQAFEAYTQIAPILQSWTGVPVRAACNEEDDCMPDLVTLVQPTGSQWTVIYRVLCLPWSDFDGLAGDARALSKRCGSRAVAFFGHDTSGAMGCEIFRKGRKAGSYDWESRDDPSEGEFTKLGLYVPPCHPRQKGDEVWVATRGMSPHRIERAHIVEIEDF